MKELGQLALFILTHRQVHDATQAQVLNKQLQSNVVLVDNAYDADALLA